jgi:hypothetical protein
LAPALSMLTRDTASSETDIDAIVSSFADLRTGASFAVADLVALNPSDWTYLKTRKTPSVRMCWRRTRPTTSATCTTFSGAVSAGSPVCRWSLGWLLVI